MNHDMKLRSTTSKGMKSKVLILKMELDTIQLEMRIKRLDHRYSRLLRKDFPSWEEMTQLLTELRQLTSTKGLDRVEDYKDRIQSIKRKVIRLQREGKLQKLTPVVMTNKSGLGLAVQLMKTEAPIEVDDSDETLEEIAELRDRLETLDWEYENLLNQEQQSVDEMQSLLEELKILKETRGIEKVPNYQGYFESIKAKVLRIYMQGKLTKDTVRS